MAWITEDVPQLRIVDEALWERAKARQQATRQATGLSLDRGAERAHRPQDLFSGMRECGGCFGGYELAGKTCFGCATGRNKGICVNRRTIERTVVEERVFRGLKDRLLHPTLIAEFVGE